MKNYLMLKDYLTFKLHNQILESIYSLSINNTNLIALYYTSKSLQLRKITYVYFDYKTGNQSIGIFTTLDIRFNFKQLFKMSALVNTQKLN